MLKSEALLARVRAEFDLLQQLGGIRARDKERLYNVIANADEGEPARQERSINEYFQPAEAPSVSQPAAAEAPPPAIAAPIFPELFRDMVCARDFVYFVLRVISVKPAQNNHLTRRMKRRLGEKLPKRNNKLYFELADMDEVFDSLILVLLNDSAKDKDITATKIPPDIVHGLAVQKRVIIDKFRERLQGVWP